MPKPHQIHSRACSSAKACADLGGGCLSGKTVLRLVDWTPAETKGNTTDEDAGNETSKAEAAVASRDAELYGTKTCTSDIKTLNQQNV